MAAPVLFSRDVYSYIAQSRLMPHGVNPYVYGTGVYDTFFTDGADAMWKHGEARHQHHSDKDRMALPRSQRVRIAAVDIARSEPPRKLGERNVERLLRAIIAEVLDGVRRPRRLRRGIPLETQAVGECHTRVGVVREERKGAAFQREATKPRLVTSAKKNTKTLVATTLR